MLDIFKNAGLVTTMFYFFTGLPANMKMAKNNLSISLTSGHTNDDDDDSDFFSDSEDDEAVEMPGPKKVRMSRDKGQR